MNNDTTNLTNYINQQRQNGYSDEAIQQSLLASGWPVTTVEQLLHGVQPAAVPNGAASQPAYQQPTQPAIAQTGLLSGRMGRLPYAVVLLWPTLVLIVIAILNFSIRTGTGAGSKLFNIFSVLVGVVCVVLIIVFSITTQVRRWHDLDQSGWLYFLNFVPVAGSIVGIVLLFIPGTPGPNRYGLPYSGSLNPRQLFKFK